MKKLDYLRGVLDKYPNISIGELVHLEELNEIESGRRKSEEIEAITENYLGYFSLKRDSHFTTINLLKIEGVEYCEKNINYENVFIVKGDILNVSKIHMGVKDHLKLEQSEFKKLKRIDEEFFNSIKSKISDLGKLESELLNSFGENFS